MTETLSSYLTFSLGDELFAANVSKVLEILDIPKLTKVPRSPDFMLGVINLRRSVLPVIDIRAKFGLPQTEHTLNTCIVVMNVSIEDNDVTIGALADSVQEVMEINEQRIMAAPSIGSKYKTEFQTHSVRWQHILVIEDGTAGIQKSEMLPDLKQIQPHVLVEEAITVLKPSMDNKEIMIALKLDKKISFQANPNNLLKP